VGITPFHYIILRDIINRVANTLACARSQICVTINQALRAHLVPLAFSYLILTDTTGIQGNRAHGGVRDIRIRSDTVPHRERTGVN
jgi:hypothetical protein